MPRLNHSLHIGIDASRITVAERTGTERYSLELIRALSRVDRTTRYTLYTNGLPAALPPLGPNMALRSIRLARLWTHARLGLDMALQPPDLLFVPSHVIPIIHPPASVVTIHDLGYLAFPETHTARRRLELHLTTRWSLHAARLVLAISAATRDDLVRHYGADSQRIRVVHHGLAPMFTPIDDPQTRAAVRAHYDLPERYLLYVGTIQPRKNLERLIRAFAAVRQQHPDLQLVIGGRRGWLSTPIEQLAQELGLGTALRFTGFLPDADLPALLSAATAFVFPSLYEGFGMPVLEAMACGTPVLCADGSALPEVTGDAALLVDPLDQAAITGGLLRLVADADLRDQLRQRGLARATRFSWERCAHETLEVLREAASANPGHSTQRTE